MSALDDFNEWFASIPFEEDEIMRWIAVMNEFEQLRKDRDGWKEDAERLADYLAIYIRNCKCNDSLKTHSKAVMKQHQKRTGADGNKHTLCPICEKIHTCKIVEVNESEGFITYFCDIAGTHFTADNRVEEHQERIEG